VAALAAALVGVGAGWFGTAAGALPAGAGALPAGAGAALTAAAASPARAPDRARGPSSADPQPATTARPASSQAFDPEEIVLPSGARAPVDAAGVTPDGVLDVPDDPARVGWWTGGARAGEPFGSLVLAGHVDTRRDGVGVLAELMALRPGSTVEVRGKGRLTYRVDRVLQAPKARLAEETDPFRRDVRHRLVLITCSGTFDTRTHRYSDNLVVIATLG
jgi:hypothetical protein